MARKRTKRTSIDSTNAARQRRLQERRRAAVEKLATIENQADAVFGHIVLALNAMEARAKKSGAKTDLIDEIRRRTRTLYTLIYGDISVSNAD